MAPENTKLPQKKRARKRKRRVASSSSESSSDSSASDSDSPAAPTATLVRRKAASSKPPAPKPASSSEESSSESSDSSDSSSASPIYPRRDVLAPAPQAARKEQSPSPPPADAAIPPFLSPDGPLQDDAVLRARFKKFWMATVADAFQDDLQELRKEPAMTKSRLAVLIDSLASGADVFATSSTPRARGDEGINEMDVVMGDA